MRKERSRFLVKPEMNFIGTTAALIGAGVASAVGGVASAAIGSHAAGQAAQTQADAATQAAQIQAQSARDALAFQQQQWQTAQQQIAPWLGVGTSAITNLGALMGLPQASMAAQQAPPAAGAPMIAGANPPTSTGRGIIPYLSERAPLSGEGVVNDKGGPYTLDMVQGTDGTYVPDDAAGGGQAGGGYSGATGNLGSLINPQLGGFGSLAQPWTEEFQAPTDVTEQNDPGYQFRLSEGLKALQNSAAARGGLLTGATAKDINSYAQNYASNEYGNVYNRALQQFQQRYNIAQQNQANLYNRLAGLSGAGQTAAGQLNSAGQNLANNATNILISSGNAQAQGLNNAAAARASGVVGGANAWTGALNAGTTALSDILFGLGR